MSVIVRDVLDRVQFPMGPVKMVKPETRLVIKNNKTGEIYDIEAISSDYFFLGERVLALEF